MDAISLFSGAGGLDLGLIRAGVNVVWANDNAVDAVQTYRKNIGSEVLHAPIEEVLASEIPTADLVVGGFPCQGFSLANKWRGPEDSRNGLYKEFHRVLGIVKPRIFLAENVKGILSLGAGEVIKKIVQDFSEVGYKVAFKLFNTADFGVPQTRQRVIIFGVRQDLEVQPETLFPCPTHSRIGTSDGLLPWVTVNEALQGIPDPELMPEALPNQDFSRYRVTDRNFTGHRLTNPDKPSPTILARGNGGGGVCALAHPNGERRMSVRESAAIQTFPLDFEFVGKMNSCYRQVGNAVPVLFAEKLGATVMAAEGALCV